MKMTKTKKSWISSVLAIIVCIAMLVGTTFAWFSDTVTSGVNKLQSGNLDVSLQYLKNGNWEDVTASTKLFNEAAHWEPGYTEVVYLKIANEGSLALKYKLSVNVANEDPGKTESGADIKLSNYLKMGVVEGVTTAYAKRSDARNAVQNAGNIASYSKIDSIIAGGPAQYVALVVYMPEEVTNEANHNGTDVPSIELGIELFATQLPHEYDSFSNNYDDPAWVVANADALVEDEAELNAALANGGLVALASDIDSDITLDNVAEDTIVNFAGHTINGTVTVAEGQTVTLNGQGGIAATGSDPAIKVGKSSDVTISGGTITSESTAVKIANTKTEEDMKLTIEEGTSITAPTLIALDAMSGYAGAEVEINGGDFTATASGSYVRPINVNGGNVTINGGTFEAPNATSYCYFIDVGEKYNTETQTYDVGSVTINGGTFKTNANYGRVVVGSIGNYANRTPGEVIINGGTFEMMGTYGVLTDVGAHVVVNDCTFKSGGNNVFSITNNNTTDRTIEVKGGDYTIATRMSTWDIPLGSFAGSYPTDSSPVGKVIISGGTINSYICDGSVIDGATSVDLVADGYKVIDNEDGTKSVVVE